MRRRRCAGSTQGLDSCRWRRIAREGERSARGARDLRAEGDRKRDALARRDRSGQR